ncbi:MAG: PorP/SprF family type IX secretion system membrane protein [Ferruginibacter sp.]|nr:PorP/SprF family type IX secretion system membrane protein [Ferruginibacter sp.]
MKKTYIIIAAVIINLTASAQQIHLSSFYDLQGLLHNPAMAGTQQKDMVAATYRSQWSGINGGPKTATIYGSFNIEKFGAGVGGYIFNDVTGPTSRRGIAFDIAKHVKVNDKAKVSLGIELKLQQYALDRNKFSTDFISDPVLANNTKKIKFDAGFGVAYVSDKFQIGASVSQLVQSKLQFYGGNLNRSEEARLYRHYYLHSNYKWQVDEATKIIPNILVTYLPNAPMEFQGGVTIEHNNAFYWGVGGRVSQSYMLNAGVIIKDKFRVGYSFDAYQTPLSTFDAGFNAHEIGLRYEF